MRPRTILGAGGALVAIAGVGLLVADGSSADGGDDGPVGPGRITVDLGIEHSEFGFDELSVVEGTEVRFVVDNGDPILHELIVGPPEVHERHENGTEAAHPPRPGEVTVEPLSVGVTTYAFDEPGSIQFACHLPGHLAYGMTGTITVVPA